MTTQAKRPTMRDVARLAGVDIAVVSRVLSGDEKLSVRAETRDRVLSSVAKLGYRPNRAARSLRTSRAGAFGLVIPDFHNVVYSTIIEGAQDAALSLDYTLLTASIAGSGRTAPKFAELLNDGTIDGMLVAASLGPDELTGLLSTEHRPIISINRRVSGLDRFLILDDARASRIGVQHLLSLGHRRIAHLAGPRHSDTAERRLQGFTAALEEAALPLPFSYVCHSDYTSRGGYETMKTLLAHPDRPTAVLVANIASALGALSATRSLGLSVPRDVSIVSIHDSDLAEFSEPALTVVRMPLYRLGFRGVELLATASPNESIHEVLEAPLELVERSSTGPVPN